MGSARAQEIAKRKLRNVRTAEDVVSLEQRAGVLVGEVVALEARAQSVRGFLQSAPLGGDRRYHEAAAVATGSALARTRDAGVEDVARAVRDTARAAGSTETITRLLDLAGAALAWATVMSLADEEAAAGMPTKSYAAPGRENALLARPPGPGRNPVPEALVDVVEGRLSCHQVFLGRCSAAQRRELAPLSVGRLVLADPRIRVMEWVWDIVPPATLVGLLAPEERHDLAATALAASELEVAW